MRVAARRQMHADPPRAPDLDRRVDDLQQQPHAVLDRAAVGVGALIAAVLQELVDQVAVGRVDLHAVEAGAPGVLGALAVGGDDAGQLVQGQRTRRHVGALRAHQADLAGRRDRAGRDRKPALEKDRVGDAADMPELRDDAPAGGMHRLGHAAPALDLRLAPQPRRVGIAHALRRDRGRFAQDQAEAGALRIVARHQRIGHPVGADRTGPRQRRHHDAVGQMQITELQRGEKGLGHDAVLLICLGKLKARGARVIARQPSAVVGAPTAITSTVPLP